VFGAPRHVAGAESCGGGDGGACGAGSELRLRQTIYWFLMVSGLIFEVPFAIATRQDTVGSQFSCSILRLLRNFDKDAHAASLDLHRQLEKKGLLPEGKG
jgi:hypothetical protein